LEEATDQTSLIVPDVGRNKDIGSRRGTVLAVGPGKWVEKRDYQESWMLNPLRFKPTSLKVGDRVIIGHYSDWESWFCDFEERAKNIVICQEGDVRVSLD